MRYVVEPSGLHRLPDVDKDMCAYLEDAIRARITTLETNRYRFREFLKWVLTQSYDSDEYAELQREWIKPKNMADAKFLAFCWYAERKIRLLEKIGLAEATPKRVLDLGCGAGHVLLIGRFLGHDMIGLDATNRPLFDALCAFWRVPKISMWIKRCEPLPVPEAKYDMVTSFVSQFDCNPWMQRGERWDIKAWDFFLEDMFQNQLAPGGKFYLHLTNDPRRERSVNYHLNRRATSKIKDNQLVFEA
jgi:SAM-dependent methyltransferase